MVELKSRRDIAGLREAGRVVAHAHQAMRANAVVGVTLADLDEVARDVLREHGATSPFLGYRPHFAATPFPGVICAAKNDVVVHAFLGTIRWLTATYSASTSARSSTAGLVMPPSPSWWARPGRKTSPSRRMPSRP